MVGVLSIVGEVLERSGIAFDTLSIIELNRSSPTTTAVAVLAFVDRRPHPSAFIKVTGDPERVRLLEQEFRNLSYLERHGSEAFRETIPKPLHLGCHEGLTVLAETAVPGTRMKDFPPDSYFSSRRFDGHFKRLVGWLEAFREATSGVDDGGGARCYRCGQRVPWRCSHERRPGYSRYSNPLRLFSNWGYCGLTSNIRGLRPYVGCARAAPRGCGGGTAASPVA